GAKDAETRSTLVAPARNTEALGRLQSGGALPERRALQRWQGAQMPSWVTQLPQSGINSTAIAEWLEGKISWPLCWVRVVDELRRHGVSERRKLDDVSAEVSRQARQALVDRLSFSARPWLLGALAGGTASLALHDGKTLEGLLPACIKESPAKAVEAAMRWFCQGMSEQDPEELQTSELCLALGFRRLQLKAHPAANGDQRQLLEASVSLELLRATAPRLSPKPSNGEGGLGELSDHELLKLLDLKKSKDPGSAAKAAGFLEGPLQRRVQKYADALDRIREDLRSLHKTLSLDYARRLLGLDRGFQEKDLTKAYRRRARQLHPDRQGEASKESFQDGCSGLMSCSLSRQRPSPRRRCSSCCRRSSSTPWTSSSWLHAPGWTAAIAAKRV
ncbi:unnamed protein product, partial [Effrenium voratum]